MNKFSLEEQYQLYLKRVNLEESRMSPVQRRETKQAFFGACGQLLILLRDDLGSLSNDEAFTVYGDLIDQVSIYFMHSLN